MRLIFLLLAASSAFCHSQSDNSRMYAGTYSSAKYTIELTVAITPSTDYSDIYRLEVISNYADKNDYELSYSKTETYFIKFLYDQFYASNDSLSVPTKNPIGTISNEVIDITDFRILAFKPENIVKVHLIREGMIEVEGADTDEPMMISPPPPDPPDVERDESSGEMIFDFAEIDPSFPGGQDSLQQFLRKNIMFPKDAGCSQGTVYVQFVVWEDGSLTDVTVAKGVTSPLDKEALRVISLMPKWIPGSQGGRIVAVKYMLPIRFHLE